MNFNFLALIHLCVWTSQKLNICLMKPADANTWINVIISGICLGPLLVPQLTFLGKGEPVPAQEMWDAPGECDAIP